MKLYIISGLGGDFKVLEKIKYPSHLEVVFIDWLIPEKEEEFDHYVDRMSSKIDTSEPFYLLGYSFGGIIVQEIHRRHPAEKIVILGSIRSHKEKSTLIKAGNKTKIPHILPEAMFNDHSFTMYVLLRKLFDPKNPTIMKYFTVKHPYYLKWSIAKISEWKFQEIPGVIQIMADKDIVFPIKLSHPDYVIKGGTHLFPVTKHREVTKILSTIFDTAL